MLDECMRFTRQIMHTRDVVHVIFI